MQRKAHTARDGIMASPDPKTAAAGTPITVTKNEKMLRIMRHEFRDPQGKFDPKPATEYLGTLLPEQVKLLQSYPREKYIGKDRLVVFITALKNAPNKEMCADMGTGTPAVKSNAKFAVFHCDTKKTITLVCYTEEFFLSLNHPKLDARKETTPTVYKLSAMDMSQDKEGNHVSIFNRISLTNGDALSGGSLNPPKYPNSIHGMINSTGCWMLFRNYNWYKPKQLDFVKAYLRYRKDEKMGKTTDWLGMLQALGYRETEGVSAKQRFLAWEANWAYARFLKDIVGIDYFSNSKYVNDLNTKDDVYRPVFPAGNAGVADNHHSVKGAREQKGTSFTMAETLLKNGNALGFPPATKFAPFWGKHTVDLEKTSWADLYVYDGAT